MADEKRLSTGTLGKDARRLIGSVVLYGGREGRRRSSSMVPLRRASGVGGRPVLRYAPTYRLESKNPIHRETCEKIIKTVMNEALHEFSYSPKPAQNMCKHISEEIKTRIKSQNYERYKIICVVTIGEKWMQDYISKISFLWDAEKDGYLSYVIDTPDFFAVATVYYLYFE